MLEKFNQIEASGEPFIDETFPPQQSSIADPQVDPADKVKKFNQMGTSFERVTEIYDDAELFKQGVDSHDINQGSLGNCYYLVALAAAADDD
jgi:hypothetical protein